jgi:hypothetical protein
MAMEQGSARQVGVSSGGRGAARAARSASALLSLALSLSLALVALSAAGCQKSQRKRPQLSTAGLTGGALVFSDDFSGAQLGAHWTPSPHPKAKVVDGWLHIEKNRNEPPLWLNVKLPEQARVEFDARSRSDEGDIKVEIFGDGKTHASGYILVFGAHNNEEDWLARLDEHGADRKSRASQGAKRDQIYHFSIIRTDGTLRWFIDNEPFLSFEDNAPLRGDAHAFFAVNTWNAPLEFDNVQVFSLE